MGDFLRNRALWIMVSGLALFWLTVWVLGSDLTRDIVDMLTMFIGIILALRYIPDAADRFRRGAALPEWRLLIGQALLWSGLAALGLWGFTVRAYDRPQWMVDSPLNGLWRYWIVAGGVLCLSATTQSTAPLVQTRIYYLFIGLAAGVLIGVAGAKFILGPL